MKEKQIKTELINRLFKVFNIDGTKNEEVMRFVPLKLKINKQKTDTVVIDLNSTDIFLGYNWLVKYNLEVNQNKEIIQFMRYSREYKTQHQNIIFTSKTRRIQLMEDIDKEYQKINKKPDTTNLEDLPKYI